jgi:hypothetical protein
MTVKALGQEDASNEPSEITKLRVYLVELDCEIWWIAATSLSEACHLSGRAQKRFLGLPVALGNALYRFLGRSFVEAQKRKVNHVSLQRNFWN